MKKNIFLPIAILQLLSAWSVCELASEAATNKAGLPLSDKPGDFDAIYGPLLSADKTGDRYAELVVALTKQGKLVEAQRILSKAKSKSFPANPTILAAAACLSHAKAEGEQDFRKYDLYNAAAVSLCKRALAADPTNKIALETLPLAEFHSLQCERARQFEESGNLESAEVEYQKLFQKRSDDVDAVLGLAHVYKRKFERHEISASKRQELMDKLVGSSAEAELELKFENHEISEPEPWKGLRQIWRASDRPAVPAGPTGDFGSDKLFFVPGKGLRKYRGLEPKSQGYEKETESTRE